VLNNPAQYNSYTTGMVKGVIAGMHRASVDRRVVAVVFTAEGDKAFCTGGNTKEYSEYYSLKPTEYALYMDLFNSMVDSIPNCKKPVICPLNGMRVGGGQELGMVCDLAISSELAMWNCISCEMWSAYKMKRLGLISKAVPVLTMAYFNRPGSGSPFSIGGWISGLIAVGFRKRLALEKRK